MRSLRSLSSVSVAAPTLITATPPANLAMRSCNFSLSNSESVSSNCFFSWARRFCTSALLRLSPEATIIVLSFSRVIFAACPSRSRLTVSRLKPTSSEIRRPPVRMAISCKTALRRSPKLGALIATTFKTPRALLTTRVAKASPSTSSAIINRGRP